MGPCWDNVWSSFAFQPGRDLKFSRLSQHGLRPNPIGCLFLGTMSVPCWDHIRPSFTFRPARALKFSKPSQNCLKPMSIECLFLRTMSGPSWGHIWPSSTLRPAEALKFVKIESTWSEANIYGVSIFGDHVSTMLGPCLA